MIRWTLEHNGYSTIVAHHGGEAMHAVRERGGQIDLLITGVIRSACGSSIAADAIRAERPGIKVLYVSKDVAGVTTPFVSGNRMRPRTGISVHGYASCQRMAIAISPPTSSMNRPVNRNCSPMTLWSVEKMYLRMKPSSW